MKGASTSILFLFLSVFVWAQSTQINLLSDNVQGTTVQLTLDGYSFANVETPQGTAQIIQIEDGTPILEKGAPDLPKISSSIVIPWDTKMEINVLNSSYKEFYNVEVAPSKGNLYRNVNPEDVAFEYGPVYQKDAFYPTKVATTRAPFVMRDFAGQTIVFNPIQYNPVSKTLRVYDEITVELTPATEASSLSRTPATGKIVAPFADIYSRQFLNFSALADYDPVADWGNMLIVAYDDYIDQMSPYARWKVEQGIPTELVPFSEVGTNQDDLLNYVRDYYNDNGLTYLLLVGDENTIPTIMVNYGGLYSCDNCFGYMSDNDHYPDLFVGRFNAEDADQVQTMIDRALEYEKNPSMDNLEWFETSLGLASNEGAGIGNEGESDYEHQNNLKTQLLDYTFASVYEFYDGSQGGVSPTPGDVTADANGNANANMINNVLNDKGASLMNYTGHGWEQGVSSGSYDVTAVNQLTNVGHYPFFIVVACCTGDFTDNAGGDCLGEAWIRATDDNTGEPTGGIGGIFASIYQSWAPPMEGQDEMINIITEAVSYSTRHTIGGIAINGFASMNDEYGASGDEMTDTWNIFGDPSVVLRTAAPSDMVVTHQPTTPMGSDQLLVNCDVEGALISITQDGILLGTGIIDNGEVTVSFNESITSVEDLKVTATAFNHIPYQGPVLVLLSGPYVVVDNYTIEDPSGNNNNLADFGESILFNVELKNIGLSTAINVKGTLTTADNQITITDNEDTWGDIESGNSINNSAAFAFTIADDIEDQHEVKFDLEITDDEDNTFVLPIKITVNAPIIEVLDISFDDSVLGNGNGRLDEGETVTLRIQNINNGHSMSPSAMGTLASNNLFLSIGDPMYTVGEISENGSSIIDAVYEIVIEDEVPFNNLAHFNYDVSAGAYGDEAIFNAKINLLVEDFESNTFDQYDWSSEGKLPWFITNEVTYEGESASQSGGISHSEESVMILDVNVLEAGEMSFHYKVSSEAEYDILSFHIDGVKQDEWSGEIDWTEVVYMLEEGEHELKWIYAKDQIFSQGDDAAWVDFVTLPVIEIVNTSTTSIFNQESFEIMPNPVAQNATITYELTANSDIQINVLNAAGQKVTNLFSGTNNTGKHQFSWNANTLSSGIYFIELRSGSNTLIKKLVKQ